jgi:hypothetical protein
MFYSMTNVIKKTISFHLHGFWFHINAETNRDQHGDRWIVKGDFLIHEHNSSQKVRRSSHEK